MRIRPASLPLFALAVAIAASAAWARPNDAAVKKELLAMFDKGVAQFKKKDIKGFMSVYTADYTGVGMDGKPMSLKQTEAEMKQAMATTKSVETAKLDIDKLTVNGKTAVAESTMKLDIHGVDSKGEMGPKGKVHQMSMVMRSRDTYVQTKDGWKTKRSEPMNGSTMMVDGKPYAPNIMAKPPKGHKP